MLSPILRRLFLLSLTLKTACSRIDERKFPSSRIITRDVAIVGGGASGTYAAVRLREDLNTSIVLIEQAPELGGHVDTYALPGTNTTIEYGVQTYIQYGPALEFFKRFGVETKPSVTTRGRPTIFVDVTTGKPLTGYIPPNSTAAFEELRRWLQVAEKYESIIDLGYWNFPAPKDIPSELLEPLAETAKRVGLNNALPLIFAISGRGTGGIEQDDATFGLLRFFGAPMTRSLLEGSFVVQVGSNSLLYDKAYDLLRNDVYLSSSIKETERSRSGVRMVVETKKGDVLIKAKRVLFTPQPVHGGNMKPFDEDKKEAEVLKKLTGFYQFAGIIHIPCIPENTNVDYLSPEAVPANYIQSRAFPYTISLTSTGPAGLGLFRLIFTSVGPFNAAEAKKTVAKHVQEAVTGGAFNYTGVCEITYKALSDHTGVEWPQDAKSLEKGFVQKLYDLQGYRSTWWTGRTFAGEVYSSHVWAHVDTLLPRLLKDLKRKA